MPSLPTVGGSVNTWGTELNEFLLVAHAADGTHGNLAVNAKDFGAVGDGIADDTAELQAAMIAAGSGTLYIPAGTYKISDTLDMPDVVGFSIRGDGRWSTIISSTVTNAPILRISPGNNENQYGTVIEELTLRFATQATTAHTDSFGIQIVGGTPLSGVFDWTVRNVRIEQSYIGIGFGSGNTVIWGCTFDKVEIRDCLGSGFKFWCTTGGPRLLFRDCVVWNGLNTMAPAGPAVTIAGGYVLIQGLEVLNWSNQPLLSTSSTVTPPLVDNFNAEGSLWSNGAFTRLVYCQGGIFRQCQFRGTASAGTTVFLFDGLGTGAFEVDGVESDVTLSGGYAYGFNECHNLRHHNVVQSQALTALYYDNQSQRYGQRGPLDVFDFGAKGDGTTDDTAEIQAAINAAAGGTCFLPEGTYKTTAPLVLPPDTQLVGTGWGSIIKGAAGANPILNLHRSGHGGVSGVGIKDLQIDGTSVATGLTGLRSMGYDNAADAARNNWAEGVKFTKCAVGARMVNDQGFAFRSCSFEANGTGLHVSDNSQLGYVEQCDFRSNTGIGTLLEATGAIITPFTPDRIYGWQFNRCHWELNGSFGLVLDGATYNTFTSCKWEQNGDDSVRIRDTNSTYRPDGNMFINGVWNGNPSAPSKYSVNIQQALGTHFLGGRFNPGDTLGLNLSATCYYTTLYYVDIDLSEITDASNSASILSPSSGLMRVKTNGTPFAIEDPMLLGTAQVKLQTGTGSPEGVLTAPVGSLYLRTDDSAALWVKQTGAGNTGWSPKNQPINAKDYGAIGDGVADDTAELQAAMNAAGSGTLYIPAGTYKISSTLDIPDVNGFSIQGAGRHATIISSTVTNAPILRVNPGNNENQIGTTIRDIQLAFATQRTTSHTDAFGIQFVGGATLAGAYHWRIENVTISRSHIGIGYGTGNTVIWGCTFDKVEIIDCTGYGIKMWNVSGAPRMLFRDLVLWNQTSLSPNGQGISIAGGYVHIDGLEVLSWDNATILSLTSTVTPPLVDNVNIENCAWSTGGIIRLFYGQGGIYRQVHVRGTSSNSSNVIVFDGLSTGSLTVDGVELDITLTTGGAAHAFNECVDLRHHNVVQTQALTFLYWDNLSQGYARRNDSAMVFLKAGAPADSDFTAPADGLMALDTTNHRLYVRDGGAWKYVTLT